MGDEVLEVNGVKMRGLNEQEHIEALTSATVLRLRIARPSTTTSSSDTYTRASWRHP